MRPQILTKTNNNKNRFFRKWFPITFEVVLNLKGVRTKNFLENCLIFSPAALRLLCPVLGAGRPLLCNLKPAHPAVRPLPSLPLKVNFTLLSKAVKVAAERRAVLRGRRRRRLWNVIGSRYEVANISPPSLPPPSPSSTSSLFSLRFLFALPFIIRRERLFSAHLVARPERRRGL